MVSDVGPFVRKTAHVGAGKIDRETNPGSDNDTPRPNAELVVESETPEEPVVVKNKAVLTVSCTNLEADVYIYVKTMIGTKENKPGTNPS